MGRPGNKTPTSRPIFQKLYPSKACLLQGTMNASYHILLPSSLEHFGHFTRQLNLQESRLNVPNRFTRGYILIDAFQKYQSAKRETFRCSQPPEYNVRRYCNRFVAVGANVCLSRVLRGRVQCGVAVLGLSLSCSVVGNSDEAIRAWG